MSDYYDLLEVTKTASDSDIKSSYRRLAKKYHPDKNTDNKEEAAAKFTSIQTAYEVLIDSNLKKTYDQFGEDGVRQFKETGHVRGEDPVPKQEVKIPITIEQIYKGGEFQVITKVLKKCDQCTSTTSGRVTCRDCQGQGLKPFMRQIAPGIMQNLVETCKTCQGQGHSVNLKKACKHCQGKETVEENVSECVKISPGSFITNPIHVLNTPGSYNSQYKKQSQIFVCFKVLNTQEKVDPRTEHKLQTEIQMMKAAEIFSEEGVFKPSFKLYLPLSLCFQKVVSFYEYSHGLEFCFENVDGSKQIVEYKPSSLDIIRDRFLLVPNFGFPIAGSVHHYSLIIELCVLMGSIEDNFAQPITEIKVLPKESETFPRSFAVPLAFNSLFAEEMENITKEIQTNTRVFVEGPSQRNCRQM